MEKKLTEMNIVELTNEIIQMKVKLGNKTNQEFWYNTFSHIWNSPYLKYDTHFDVVLRWVDRQKKINTIKLIREYTNIFDNNDKTSMGLMAAKNLYEDVYDGDPRVIVRSVDLDEAQRIAHSINNESECVAEVVSCRNNQYE